MYKTEVYPRESYAVGNKPSFKEYKDVGGGKRKNTTTSLAFTRARATILSDSICQGMRNMLQCDVQCIHGGAMARVTDYIRHGVLNVHGYQLVILHFSTNDLNARMHFTTCAEQIVTNLDRAIHRINQINPRARLAVSGILPRLVDHSTGNWEMIQARVYTNVSMRDYCDNHGIFYLTSETMLKGHAPVEIMYRPQDELHLSPYGSYYFQSYLEGKVGELLGPAPRLHRPIAVLPPCIY